MARFNREDYNTTLPQIEKKLDNLLVAEKYDFPYDAIANDSQLAIAKVKTKRGYYPLGIIGFRTRKKYLLVTRCELDQIKSGSCRINFAATSTSAITASNATVWVLWIKE